MGQLSPQTAYLAHRSKVTYMRIRSLILALITLLITACSYMPILEESGNYADPIGYSSVTNYPTIYSAALICLRPEYAKKPDTRIAVDRVADLTNTRSIRDGGFVSAGGTLMVISALSKANIHLVERTNMQVARDEMDYAMDKILGHPSDENFKKLHAGQVRSSDYFITGGITELNFNIKSNQGELKIPEIGIGTRYAVMNVALDLRAVKTETLEIENVVSFQKQIIGKEFKAGFFDFIGSTFTVGLFKDKRTEPIQFGVRTVIERAVIDLISPIFEVDPHGCLAKAEFIFAEDRKKLAQK